MSYAKDEDLAGSRHRNDVVSVLLNKGSISFGDSRRKTNVLVIPLVILEHLVADKVVLDSYCSASGTTLTEQLNHFINILSGKDNKVFKDQNRLFTLVRYIWFNVAILSLTDSNIVDAINMTQRDLGASIYNDYMAILSLINTYGRDITRFSIGKLIEAYTCRDTKNTFMNTKKISTEPELNSVLKQLINVTSAFSKDHETNGVKDFKNVEEIRNIIVTLDINKEDKTKIDDLMEFLISIINSSTNIKNTMMYISNDNAIPDPVPIIVEELGSMMTRLSDKKTIEIDYNDKLKDSVINGYRRRMQKLSDEQDDNKAVIDEYSRLIQTISESESHSSFKVTYNIPKGITVKSATGMISALNERYPYLTILLTSITKFKSLFITTSDNKVNIELNNLKDLLRHGNIIALTCLSTTYGNDFISGGMDILAKVLAHFSAEATLALSRKQRTFSPIHPGLLVLYDTFKPSKDNFEHLNNDFVKSVIEKIEEGASPILSRCSDDAGVARGLTEAGKNYNEATTNTLQQHIRNPTDIFNNSSLAHFDTIIVPKHVKEVLTAPDLLKLSAFWQGIGCLPESTDPSKWNSDLVGNKQYGSYSIPGLSNVCTFNSALNTILANPEESCKLITREITRNSARLVHDLSSNENIIENMLDKGTVSVIQKSQEKEEGRESFDIFSTTTSSTIGSAIGLISNRCYISSDDGNDLIFNTVRSIPEFKRNIIEATRSLFELAAICNLLSSDPTAKEASKKIINIIKDTSLVLDEIGINRITGLVSSITTPKQYKKFLNFVDEKRRYWIKKAVNVCGDDGNDENVYLGLSSVSISKTKHMPDKFWLSVFEDCDIDNDEDDGNRLFTSKLNSYAAVATNANRDNAVSRQNQINITDIEKFIIQAARTNLHDDSNVALSNLLKAQRLYARVKAAVDIRNCESNINLSIPSEVNIISGVFDEITSDADSTAGSLVVLASKLMVAKELVKHSSTPESFQYLLASMGVETHGGKLAEIICERITSDDIKLFFGGAMLQRGLFTTFLLNDILARQISPELKTELLSKDTKKNYLI